MLYASRVAIAEIDGRLVNSTRASSKNVGDQNVWTTGVTQAS